MNKNHKFVFFIADVSRLTQMTQM